VIIERMILSLNLELDIGNETLVRNLQLIDKLVSHLLRQDYMYLVDIDSVDFAHKDNFDVAIRHEVLDMVDDIIIFRHTI